MRDFLMEMVEHVRPMGLTTVLGAGDVETVIRAAAMSGAWMVEDQKAKASGRRDVVKDAQVRFASDDFVAGYALGGALTHVWGNGRHLDDLPFDELVAETYRRLENELPALDVMAAYRGASRRFIGGAVAGIWEPGRKEEPSILAYAWKRLSEHTLLYGTGLYQYAVNEVGVDYRDGDFIQEAGDEMFARYMTFAKAR